MDSEQASQEELDRQRRILMFMCNEENDSESCHKLGYFYEVLEKKIDQAKEQYVKNCMKNRHVDSCFKMGSYMFMGLGGFKGKRNEGLEILNNNCVKNGHDKSCYAAGNIYVSKTLGKTEENPYYNPEKGVDFLVRSCEKGNNGNSCTYAGHHFYTGTKVGKDATKALRYFSKGCDLMSLQGCNNAALMMKRGYGEVESNPKMYEEFREKLMFLAKKGVE